MGIYKKMIGDNIFLSVNLELIQEYLHIDNIEPVKKEDVDITERIGNQNCTMPLK